MDSILNISGFILTILPIALSPGASFTLAMANVTNQGMKGLATVILGTALGIYTHALLAGLGISSILEKYPLLIGSIKIIGTLYLVFLSIILIKNGMTSVRSDKSKMPKSATVKNAYIANVLNVKAIVLYLTVIPGFLFPYQVTVIKYITLASIHISIMVIWLLFSGFLVIFAARKTNLFAVSKFINIFGGSCLLYFSLLPYLGTAVSISSLWS